jgi:hypothetical protein
MNAWKHKDFCTWEFRITSICMNKYTTQRKFFKLSIIQVCIRYKMGQLTAEQRVFKRFSLIWIWKGVHFFDTRWNKGNQVTVVEWIRCKLVYKYVCYVFNLGLHVFYKYCRWFVHSSKFNVYIAFPPNLAFTAPTIIQLFGQRLTPWPPDVAIVRLRGLWTSARCTIQSPWS